MVLVDYALESQLIGYMAMQVLFVVMWLEYSDDVPALKYLSMIGFIGMAIFMKFAMGGIRVVG